MPYYLIACLMLIGVVLECNSNYLKIIDLLCFLSSFVLGGIGSYGLLGVDKGVDMDKGSKWESYLKSN